MLKTLKNLILPALLVSAFFCCSLEDIGRGAPFSARVMLPHGVPDLMLPGKYVLSITVTGTKFKSHQTAALGKEVRFSAPVNEALRIEAIVFPVGPKNDKQLYYACYPADPTQTAKIEPNGSNITLEFVPAPLETLANGGVIYYMNNGNGTWDEMHLFTYDPASQFLEFMIPQQPDIYAQLLLVGGGGGGGSGGVEGGSGGGGGGGAVVYRDNYHLTEDEYKIAVGGWGGGGGTPAQPSGDGGQGSSSRFAPTPLFDTPNAKNISAHGGGSGGGPNTPNGGYSLKVPPDPNDNTKGGGGGGASLLASGTLVFGAEVDNGPGYSTGGWKGGGGTRQSSTPLTASPFGGGGGGGMDSIGSRGQESVYESASGEIPVGYGGNGGIGLLCAITGKPVYHGGGGGGGGTIKGGSGGKKGGGGDGGCSALGTTAEDGKDGAGGSALKLEASAGGGGGGGASIAGTEGKGGNGGNGIVIVRFPFKLILP